MELLLQKVIECIALEKLESKDFEEISLLIKDLFGERKNLFWGIKSQTITPEEAASVMLGHMYTENGGYFREKKLVNFNVEKELAKVLATAI